MGGFHPPVAFQPRTHKTKHFDRTKVIVLGPQAQEHFDRTKVIVLGPQAQEVLRPWLDRDPASYGFVPAETAAWSDRRHRRREPSGDQVEGGEANPLRRSPGQRYTRHSDRVAVQRACRRAGIPVGSPRQLRHTRATTIRQAYGLEAAKAVLGHADTKITAIDAESPLA